MEGIFIISSLEQSKSLVREVESEHGEMIIDDLIENKQYTDENDIICSH